MADAGGLPSPHPAHSWLVSFGVCALLVTPLPIQPPVFQREMLCTQPCHYTKENTLALRHDFPYVSRHTQPKIEPPAVKTSTVWGKWKNPLEKQRECCQCLLRRLLRAHLGVVSKQISKSPILSVGEFHLPFLATLRDETEGCDVKLTLLDPRTLCPGSLLTFGTSRLKSLTRNLVASLSLVQSRPWNAHGF